MREIRTKIEGLTYRENDKRNAETGVIGVHDEGGLQQIEEER